MRQLPRQVFHASASFSSPRSNLHPSSSPKATGSAKQLVASTPTPPPTHLDSLLSQRRCLFPCSRPPPPAVHALESVSYYLLLGLGSFFLSLFLSFSLGYGPGQEQAGEASDKG